MMVSSPVIGMAIAPSDRNLAVDYVHRSHQICSLQIGGAHLFFSAVVGVARDTSERHRRLEGRFFTAILLAALLAFAPLAKTDRALASLLKVAPYPFLFFLVPRFRSSPASRGILCLLSR